MSRFIRGSNFRGLRWGVAMLALILALIIAGNQAWGAPAPLTLNRAVLGAGAYITAGQGLTDAPAGGQQFEDVPPGYTFYDFINNIYLDGIVSGYPCGGPGEPCVPPDNRPYYRPSNNVTRGQMSKFLDLGRRNIADAIGDRLVITNSAQVGIVISSTTTDSLDAYNASGAEAIQAGCLTPGVNCWAFYGYGASGDRAGVFSAGRGLYGSSSDDNYPGVTGVSTGVSAAGVQAHASGTTSYGLESISDAYRSTYITRTDPGWFALEVDSQPGEPATNNVANFELGVRVVGNLTVLGSKSGYVVDAMQNAGSEALEAGDVVTIVGNSAPVLGEIPVVTVKKANSAYDTGVVGIVDQMLYVPDAATKAAYEAQENARRAAMAANAAAQKDALQNGGKVDAPAVPVPEARITDAEGTVHAVDNVTQAAPGGYLNVVTLGAYKGIKVDASFGAIHAGDLLTSSPHAGYAMRVSDRAQSGGAVIGKALGDLAEGTGLIPVMVTLK